MKQHDAGKAGRARVLRSLTLMVAVLVAFAACDDSGTGSDDTRVVTLGGVFSLTGNWSTLGATSKAAMELAVADVNEYAEGRGIEFRVDVRDTKLEPATALAA